MARHVGWLLLALLVTAPALGTMGRILTVSAFLVEFLSDGAWRPLTLVTAEPAHRPLTATAAGRPVPVDLYPPRQLLQPPGLVLVHGLSPLGKDDPRLRQAAQLLARAGWAVAVPTVDGLTRLRLRPGDTGAVTAAARALSEAGYVPVAILAVSLGAGPALLAAIDTPTSPALSAVLLLGGYASSRELLRYTLTGAYRFGPIGGRRVPDDAAITLFARANSELVDAAGGRLVVNRDPEAFDALVEALPSETKRLLNELSPEERMARLPAPLFLVHGRNDPAVPFTESLRLLAAARAARRPARLAIVGGVGHVEPDRRATAAELLRLGATFYAFSVSSGLVTPPGPAP